MSYYNCIRGLSLSFPGYVNNACSIKFIRKMATVKICPEHAGQFCKEIKNLQ